MTGKQRSMKPSVRRWSEDELALLRMDYPTLGPEAVADMLPGRTVVSVKRMANRLRLSGPNHKQWSAEEDQVLISNYHHYGASRVAELTGRTVEGVIHRAAHLRESIKTGLSVNSKPLNDRLISVSRSKGTKGGRPPIHTIQKLDAHAKGRGGKCLSLEYLGLRKQKHHWRCAEGHTWYATWDAIQKGSWCPVCREPVKAGDKIKKTKKVQVRHEERKRQSSIEKKVYTAMDTPKGGAPVYQSTFTDAYRSIKASDNEVARIMALSTLPVGVLDKSIMLGLAAKADPDVEWYPYCAEALSIQLLAFLEAEGYSLDKFKIDETGKVTQWPKAELVVQEQQNLEAEEKYLTTEELAARIKYDPRTILQTLKDRVLLEGVHYFRPFGGRKILFIWEAVESTMRELPGHGEGDNSTANEE